VRWIRGFQLPWYRWSILRPLSDCTDYVNCTDHCTAFEEQLTVVEVLDDPLLNLFRAFALRENAGSGLLSGIIWWERTHVRSRNAPDTAVPPAHHDLPEIIRSSIERRFTTGKVSTGFGYDDHSSLLPQSRSAL
jgi:hypothetical protein